MKVEIKIEDPGDAEDVEVTDIYVTVGATVNEGDLILEVATDKANVEVATPKAGTVVELAVAEGDFVSPDKVLAVVEINE